MPDKVIVCGLGPSLDLVRPVADQYCTVGVNDIERFDLTPDHLVLINKLIMFKDPHRLETITQTQAETVWSIHDLPRPDVNLISLRYVSLPDPITSEMLDGDPVLTYTTSTFSAVHIAYRVGARRIGLAGCDLLGHKLAGHAPSIDAMFQKMRQALALCDVELVNLSPESLLTLPHVPLESF